MDLVVDNIPVSSGVVLNYVDEHIQEHVCSSGSSSNLFDESKSIDGTIYNVLSRQNEMKTLVYPDRIKGEFDLYLEYAEAKTSGETISDDFNDFDIYLGSIGVVNGNIC